MDDYDGYEAMNYPDEPGYERGSDTSKAAAKSVNSNAWRLKVEECMRRAHDGTIDDELEVLLGMRHQSASPRRRELEMMHRVIGTGRKRKTRSGRSAQVYVHIDNAPPELLAKLTTTPGADPGQEVHLSDTQRDLLVKLSSMLDDVRERGILEPECAVMRLAIAALLGRCAPTAMEELRQTGLQPLSARVDAVKPWQVVIWPPAA